MASIIALLRAVNVGASRKLPMAELRALCAELGWKDARTYIQSGNLLFDSAERAEALEEALEAAIAGRFGLDVPVVVRSAGQWAAYAEANPFPEAAEKEPNRLMLMLSKAPPGAGAAAALQERARDGEVVRQAGDAIWIHYAEGAGTSRLSPALIDRLVGSPATARNYRTVVKLREMLAQ